MRNSDHRLCGPPCRPTAVNQVSRPPNTAGHSGGNSTRVAAMFKEMAGRDPRDPRRAELREQLVTEHVPLARTIACRFKNRGQASEDLLQVAFVGMINAIDRFDPGRGHEFRAFAVPTITGELRRYFRDASWAVRVPRRLKERHLATREVTADLAQVMGKVPTPAEIARHLDLTVDEVYDALQASRAHDVLSMDEVVGGDSTRITRWSVSPTSRHSGRWSGNYPTKSARSCC